MRLGQYNNRKPKNAVGAGKQSSGNEFNSSLKRERHPEPPQYPTSKVDERKKVSESRDARPKESGSRSQSSSSRSSSSRRESSSSSKSSASRNSASNNVKQMQNAARSVVRSTVVMVGGTTTVLANTVMPELKTTISETFHIEVPTIVETVAQSGENTADWLVEGDEAGIFEEGEEETLEEDLEADDPDETDEIDEDSDDNDDRDTEDGDEETAPPDEDAAETPPEQPEEVPEDVSEEEPEEVPEEVPEELPEEVPEEAEEEPEEEVEEETEEEPVEEPEVPEQPATPSTPSGGSSGPIIRWTWSDGNAGASVWVQGYGTAEATVKKEEKPATCTEDGSITYTATATVGEQIYTDTRTEKTADATGHTFGAPQTSNGKTVYHCSECGKDFVINYGISEEK